MFLKCNFIIKYCIYAYDKFGICYHRFTNN